MADLEKKLICLERRLASALIDVHNLLCAVRADPVSPSLGSSRVCIEDQWLVELQCANCSVTVFPLPLPVSR
jgi:hypothetical protein